MNDMAFRFDIVFLLIGSGQRQSEYDPPYGIQHESDHHSCMHWQPACENDEQRDHERNAASNVSERVSLARYRVHVVFACHIHEHGIVEHKRKRIADLRTNIKDQKAEPVRWDRKAGQRKGTKQGA